MNVHTKRKIRKLFSPFVRLGLKNRTFTIISNNCWGGVVYDKYGLRYLTPTIGCFLFSKDYISFLAKLEYYLKLPLVEVKFEESSHYEYLKKRLNNCVIGKLDDIEIIFLHYGSFEDASKKWNKRKVRVNLNNLLIKYSDQNQFDISHFKQFENLPYKNKIFITTNKSISSCSVKIIYLNDKSHVGYAADDIKPSLNKINLKHYLNKMI